MSGLYAATSAPVASSSSAGQSLKASTVIFAVLGMIMWAVSIGFMVGWEYSDVWCSNGGLVKVFYGSIVSVPTNAAMIYVTARIIFLIMSRRFPSEIGLHDLHQCVARLVAFSLVSLTMWAASLSWLVKSDCEPNIVYHVCNYGFVISILVAGLAGGLLTVSSKVLIQPQSQTQQVAGTHYKYPAPPPPPPPPQTHYNQAYTQYRG